MALSLDVVDELFSVARAGDRSARREAAGRHTAALVAADEAVRRVSNRLRRTEVALSEEMREALGASAREE